ncbi:MAG TPA: WhiB family transcriptional regulator [Streptosporangiaceae bacterium]|nr:WhiB family transcriptional regulator [Streptosporangiaceae bacterium]
MQPGRGAGVRMRPRRAGPAEVACRSAPELFFAEQPADVRRAKELCRHCPLQPACLAGALRRGEPWGVWGGELFLRGVVVADKRPRGRPRKADVAA